MGWRLSLLHRQGFESGFDILEIAAGPLPEYSDEELKELKNACGR